MNADDDNLHSLPNTNGEVERPPEEVGADDVASHLAALTDRLSGLTETNRQLRRKIFDLYTIFEISRDFNSVLNYRSLLDTFILTSLAQVSASKAAIFLPDEKQRDRYVLTRAKGSGKFPDRRQFFRTGSRLMSYLSKLNRPLPTGEVLGDIARRGERRILELFHPGLIVPLIYQTQLRGVFLITDKLKGRSFDADDIEFLSVLGNQISVAIENARLYEAEKMTSRQLQAAQSQLVHSERLAALGEMSAKVAHEINNPLGIIKNYLHLIRRSTGESASAGEYVDIVGQEIDRIARIVRELLDFHRPHKPVFRKLEVASVLDDVLALIQRKFESSGIAIDRDFAEDCPTIDGSSENLKQVFLNLFMNAADVMGDGGTLTVRTRHRRETVRIEVHDTGPGIEPELIPRIFEPFFTTKEPGSGTGLGLSVCYGIVRRHQGNIAFNNTESGGCFAIELPINHESNGSSRAQTG